MRVAFALAGLALSVVVIGACGEGHYKDADAVTCMAYLSLQSAAVVNGGASGDAAALDTANAAWRALAEQKYTAEELAQYFASTVAVFDEVEPSDREMISSICQAQAPVAA